MLQNIHVIKISVFVIISILFIRGICYAHKVNIFAYVEGQKVMTESYFNDGRKCQGAQILVFDKEGNQLLEGKANNEGEFSFVPPLKTDLKIVLEASMGHRAEFIMKAEELEDIMLGESDTVVPENLQEKKPSHDTGEKKAQTDKEMSGISREEITSIMEEVLDKKLAPIIRMQAKQGADRGISFHDIIGGVGYILGLMGVIFLFRPKKES
ncbi:MAG: hypothetical protein ACMUJM_01130 [bacterium]